MCAVSIASYIDAVDTLIGGLSIRMLHLGISGRGVRISPMPVASAVLPVIQYGTSAPSPTAISFNSSSVRFVPKS